MAVMHVSVSRLESEKRALSIRLGAMKNAMQQLEREALIRSGVQFEMAAATSPQPSQVKNMLTNHIFDIINSELLIIVNEQ